VQGLGELAAKYRPKGVWVQSHMAETPDEMEFVSCSEYHHHALICYLFH
jgi:cytosine/adenosine deaminase-related metal-dependent hydrolase